MFPKGFDCGKSLRAVLTTLAFSLLAIQARADGLIFRLPPDGTRAVYQCESDETCWITLSDKIPAESLVPEARHLLKRQTVHRTYSVTVSSVGEATRARQACRWIEFNWPIELPDTDTHAPKLLIPEKCLVRGKDPLDHAILTFFNPKSVDRGKLPAERGFDRIRYEIDRVRPLFAKPLVNERRLPDRTIETPVRVYEDCEVITGRTSLEGTLMGESWWEFRGEWEFALHADAPFGVVRATRRMESEEIDESMTGHSTATTILTLSRIDKDAVSALPNGEPARGDDE
jgi:hypothetical protein